MKAKYILIAMLASMVSFISCGGDGDDDINPEVNNGNSNNSTTSKEWRITKITRVTELGSDKTERIYNIAYDSYGRVSQWQFGSDDDVTKLTWGESEIKEISGGYTIDKGLITEQNKIYGSTKFSYIGGYKETEKSTGGNETEYTYTWEAGLLTAYKYSYHYTTPTGPSISSMNYVIEYGNKVWPQNCIGPFYSLVADIHELYGKHPYLLPERKMKAEKYGASATAPGGTKYTLETEYSYAFNENQLLTGWVEKYYNNNGTVSYTITNTLEWSEIDVRK